MVFHPFIKSMALLLTSFPKSTLLLFPYMTAVVVWFDILGLLIVFQTSLLIFLGINIVRRKRSEKALKDATSDFVKIYRNSPEIFVVTSLDEGELVEVNLSFERAFGYSRDEVIGKTSLQLNLWADRQDRDRIVAEVKKNGFVSGKEVTCIRRSGEKFIVLFSAIPIFLNKKHCWLTLALEITERKKIEEDLRKSEERYALAQKAANIGSWDWDIVKGTLSWSDTIESLFGFLPGEFGGTYEAFLRCVHPEDRDLVLAAVDASINGNKEYAIEHRIVWPNGTVRWMSETGRVVHDQSGKPTRMLGIVQDITMRKQAEEDLSAKTAEIDQFFSCSLDLLCIADAQGYFRRLNPEWEKALGYKLSELENHRFLEFVHPDDVETTLEVSTKMRTKKEALKFINRYRCKDGSYRWLEWRAYALGEYMYAVARDITEHLHIQKVLIENKEKYKALVGAVADAIYIFTFLDGKTPGNFLEVNDEACRMLGYSKEEFLQMSLIDVDASESGVDIKPLFESLLRGKVIRFEQKHVRRDGLIVPVEVQARLMDLDGKKVIFSTVRDISERKKAEDALLKSEMLYRLLADNSLDIISMHDKEGRIIYVSNACRDILGYAPEELLGIPSVDLIHPGEKQMALEMITKTIMGKGGSYTIQYRLRRKDGNWIWMETKGKIIYDKAGEIVEIQCVSRDISERKKAEEALKESEERFRYLSDAAFEGIMVHDNGIILDVNKAFLDLFWYTAREEMVGKHILDVLRLAPESREEVEKQLCLKTGQLHENRLISPNGEIRFVEVLARDFKYRDRHARVVTMRDITERRKIEDDLRESENRYRELVGRINSAVAVYETKDGVDFFIKDFNPAGENIERMDKNAIIGRNVVDVFPGVEVFGLLDVFRRVWRTGESEHHPVTVYQDEYITGWRENYVYKLHSGEVVAVYEDVTQRKLAEEAIRESEERFRIIVDSAQDGVLGLDILTGKFVFTSPKICSMLGYSSEELQNMEAKEIYPETSLPLIEEQLNKQIRGELIMAVDIPVKRQDGSIFFADISSSLVTFKGRKTLISFFRDTTEQKQAREELIQKNKELENYTYLVSHDLKEPIRSIHLFSQLIKKENWDQLSESGREYLDRVLRASNRVGHMISDLLVLSRIGRKDVMFDDVDINRLLESVLEDLSRQIHERNALINNHGLPVIKCQRVWMTEIFKNLISNGIKYNESPQPVIDLSCVEQKDKYEFSVKDNGIGMAAKYHESVFELFRRLHGRDEYEGTGAGLTIVRSILTQHNGHIWVASSDPQNGTVFKFIIPKNL